MSGQRTEQHNSVCKLGTPQNRSLVPYRVDSQLLKFLVPWSMERNIPALPIF